jgi:L-malate glycosyltransferase
VIAVHQILSSAGERDAVTHEARQFRALFGAWGWGGRDHAARIPPGLREIAPLGELSAGEGDVLLIHHSASTPHLAGLLALPNRKLLVYHNITPAEFLWSEAPLVAGQCAVGREQLAALVEAVDVAAAHSAFNAAELQQLGAERTEVIPVLVDLDRLGPPGAGPPALGPATVLFVGRLSPHKRQDELIRAFALYRAQRNPSARLTLVGERLTAGYIDGLHELAARLAPGAVTVESGLSTHDLGERYRAASVFVCLSEHEGFCVPLLEAFHADLPVIARPNAAIPETAGDAAVLVADRDPAVIAELIHLAVTDGALRSELIDRGRRRLGELSSAETETRLRAAVEAAASVRA